MKKRTSIIGQLLSGAALLIGMVAAIAAGNSFLQDRPIPGLAIVAIGFVICSLLVGLAEVVNAVVRTADACEEIAKQQRELRRAATRP